MALVRFNLAVSTMIRLASKNPVPCLSSVQSQSIDAHHALSSIDVPDLPLVQPPLSPLPPNLVADGYSSCHNRVFVVAS